MDSSHVHNDNPPKTVTTKIYTTDREGFLHGEFALWWCSTGKRQLLGTYEHGVKHGIWKAWTAEGKLKFCVRYRDGKLAPVRPFDG